MTKAKLLSKKQIDSLFEILAATIKPEGELNYRTSLDLLIAVVLSAQSTDVAVNKVTDELWKKCRSAEDYLVLGEEQLKEYLRKIGLFRNKARAIIGLCKMLIEDFNGEVPDTREELMKLPGVGRKTANVVLNIAFKQPTIAVDTHVFRVANRTGLANADKTDGVEEQLNKKVPEKYKLNAHHYLILHGRYCCKARKPLCNECSIEEICKKNL